MAGLEIEDPAYPPTHQREFPQLGVTLPVYESSAVVSVPVTAEGELFAGGYGVGKQPTVAIPVRVNYQACSETVCYRPRPAELTVQAPLAALVLPDFRR